MAIPPYNQGYPPDGSSLGQTKTTIRNNLDGTFLTLGIDHINNNGQPGAQPAGYHNVARWVPKAGNPVAIAGYGQLYSRTVSGDQQLFWETGNGVVSQITSGVAPVAGANGRTTFPGGLILQWGFVNGTHGGGSFNGGDTNTVTFATTGIAFPSNCFNIWTQPFYPVGNPPGNASTATIAVATNFTRLAFTWTFCTVSASYTRFFWFAIGN
jgi:hypothetical protein